MVTFIGWFWLIKNFYIIFLKGQIGTAWIPNADSTDEKLSLDKVEVLMYLFAIQLGLAIIGILSDWMDCNKKDEEAAPAPAAGRKISAKKEKA